MIPFLDLRRINQRFDKEFLEATQQVFESGWYLLGSKVSTFEKNFADYCGVKHCIGVANGLDALIIILEAYKVLGKIQAGDEVIVPANTYIATVMAITRCGLIPLFVEPEASTMLISNAEIVKKISKKTKVIMPVHLYGQICEMDGIWKIASEHNLFIIEDSAQSHGAYSVSYTHLTLPTKRIV